jgi:hypothetical protein
MNSSDEKVPERRRSQWKMDDRCFEILTGLGEELDCGWGTNKLRGLRTEYGDGFGNRSRERGGCQDRLRGDGLSIESNVGRGADGAGMVRGGRILGVGVNGLHRSHHANQGHAEHA